MLHNPISAFLQPTEACSALALDPKVIASTFYYRPGLRKPYLIRLSVSCVITKQQKSV